MIKRLLSTVFLLGLIGTTAHASDIYVAASAGTFTGGSACNGKTAIVVGSLPSLNPDDTVYICGTITGGAGGQFLSVGQSGTNGHPITIKFDLNAILTSPAWGGFGAIAIYAQSWITIDGGTNGVIQNTDNGSTLGHHDNSAGVWVGLSSNIVVKNLTISNMCQHTLVTDRIGCQTSGNTDAAIKVNNNGGGGSNITITRNTIHDTFVGVYILANGGDINFTVTNNTISRANWSANFGAGVGTSGPWIFSNNDLSCVAGGPCNWDDDNNDFHHNGIIVDFGDNVFMTGMVIANNYFHDINPCTAFTFITPVVFGGTGDVPGLQMYNNIGFTSPGQAGPANGYFGSGQTNPIIVNNTIVGGNTPIGLVGLNGTTIKNNIVSTVQYGIDLPTGYSGIASDYNDIYNLTQGMQAGATFYGSLAAWKAGTGFDPHSINTNPNLTAAFLLNIGSPAIGTGTNLTSLGITGLDVGAPATFGVNGSCGGGCVARPSSGAWDMGAYPRPKTGAQSPNPPTTLSSAAH